MAEHQPRPDVAGQPEAPVDEAQEGAGAAGAGHGGTSGTAIVLWALASIALLAFVTLGSIPTYVWRFNRKYEESRSILRIWVVEASNLPRVSQQWAIDGAFYAALVLFLMCVVAGLWFLVKAEPSADDDRQPSPPVPGMTQG